MLLSLFISVRPACSEGGGGVIVAEITLVVIKTIGKQGNVIKSL